MVLQAQGVLSCATITQAAAGGQGETAAHLAESVDAEDLKSFGRKPVRVQLPGWAPFHLEHLGTRVCLVPFHKAEPG